MPEKCRDHTNNDNESCKIETESGAGSNRKVDMEIGPDCTIKDQRYSVACVSKDQAIESFAPARLLGPSPRSLSYVDVSQGVGIY